MASASTVSFATAQQVRADLAQLQGIWNFVTGARPGELMIAGNLYTVKFLDGALYMGAFDLDLDVSPKGMNMRIDEGPLKHKGLVAPCIYELEGDLLRWSPGEPGSEEFPTAFPDPGDERQLCLVFRRYVPQR